MVVCPNKKTTLGDPDLEMMIEVVGHPLAQTDGNLYLILAL